MRLGNAPLQLQVNGVGFRRIMKRDRAIFLSMHELVHKRVFRFSHLRRRALRDDYPVGDEIHVVNNFQRLLDVVCAQRSSDASVNNESGFR